MLQKADPSGEEHVCVENCDISWIDCEPAYYDGSQQILIRNEKGKIIGGKYHRNGKKIQIHLMSFNDVLWDREIPIDYSELNESRQEECKKNHEDIVKRSKEIQLEIELEFFTEFVKSKIADLDDEAIKAFYNEHYTPNTSLPVDIAALNKSFHDRRIMQWERQVGIKDGKLERLYQE